MDERFTRRDALKAAGVAAAALVVAPVMSRMAGAQTAAQAGVGGGARRGLRIAHLTDLHVQPERRGGEGLSACLRHVNGLADKPDLIVTGGDQVFDSFDQGFERTQKLWELWRSCFKNDNGLAAKHVLGNHDVWGWNKKKSKCTGEEARFGKAWACEMFERERSYTSFDQGGWHLVLLDSIQPKGEGYVGRLDDEQYSWLEQDLKGTTAPVVVFSHIPIFSACVFNDGAKKKDDPDNWHVSGGLMHGDALKIRKLFQKHPNVKLCVSGHIHQRDRVEFNDVTYICDGAVCGKWWNGRHEGCDEGYGLIDLYSNGTFAHAYQSFGWQAEGAAPK